MLAHDSALKTITVNKRELLTKLRENRTKHIREFEEAAEEYWTALATELTILATKVGDREGWNHQISIVPPSNHTNDYTDTIELLEWEVENEVEISNADFKRFIQDKWDWQRNFKAYKRQLEIYNSTQVI